MLQPRTTKLFRLTTILLAAYPLLWLVALLGFVIQVRLQVGYWPYPYHPDPKEVGWVQTTLLVIGLAAAPAAAFLAAGFAVVGRVHSRDFPFWAIIAIAIVANAVLVVFARLDPFHLMYWLFD